MLSRASQTSTFTHIKTLHAPAMASQNIGTKTIKRQISSDCSQDPPSKRSCNISKNALTRQTSSDSDSYQNCTSKKTCSRSSTFAMRTVTTINSIIGRGNLPPLTCPLQDKDNQTSRTTIHRTSTQSSRKLKTREDLSHNINFILPKILTPFQMSPLEHAQFMVRASLYTVTRVDLQHEFHWKRYILQLGKVNPGLKGVLKMVAKEPDSPDFPEQAMACSIREKLCVDMVDNCEVVDLLIDYVVLNAGLRDLDTSRRMFGLGTEQFRTRQEAFSEALCQHRVWLLAKGIDVRKRPVPRTWSRMSVKADRKVNISWRLKLSEGREDGHSRFGWNAMVDKAVQKI
jgi:hypothetical protein